MLNTIYRFKPDKPVFATLPDGGYALYDPRLILHENTLESPLMDGGGNSVIRSSIRSNNLVAKEKQQGGKYLVYNDKNIALCSNEEPNFLNQNFCRLSFEPNACISKSQTFVDARLVLTLDGITLAALHNATLGGAQNVIADFNVTANVTADDNSTEVKDARYIYAVSNLRYDDSNTDGVVLTLPCMSGSPMSRWILRKDLVDANCTNSLHQDSVKALKFALETSNDENPYLRDIVLWNSVDLDGCDAADLMSYGMLIMTDEGCWENVHPDYM